MKNVIISDISTQKRHFVICKGSLPKSKHYKETQFSTIKCRRGRESVPFLGLSPGTHKVKFVDGDKSKLCLVKVWISLYGDAWQIIKACYLSKFSQCTAWLTV